MIEMYRQRKKKGDTAWSIVMMLGFLGILGYIGYILYGFRWVISGFMY